MAVLPKLCQTMYGKALTQPLKNAAACRQIGRTRNDIVYGDEQFQVWLRWLRSQKYQKTKAFYEKARENSSFGRATIETNVMIRNVETRI